MTLTDQLLALLQDRAARLADLLSDPQLRVDLEDRIAAITPRLSVRLDVTTAVEVDEHEAAEIVADLYALAHGDSDPAPEWWQTPLGRVTARSTGAPDTEAITPSIAAVMLGIGERRVYQLRDKGKLVRHPDGGVTRASVLARLVDQTQMIPPLPPMPPMPPLH